MKKLYRIFISIGVAIVMMFLATIILVFLKIESPVVLGLITISAFTITYKMIPASKQEADRKNTILKEIHHKNGVLKESGALLHGKRIGQWSVFDEEGQWVRTDIYEDGMLLSSKSE
jgi:hypothetical protein